MSATAALANRLDVRLHTHLGETEDENRYCEEIYRCRPLDYLEQCGWLHSRTWLAHGIHFNAKEMTRLGQGQKPASSHCACSNQLAGLRLLPRSATWKRPAWRSASASTASASNDASNLMQEVRAAFPAAARRPATGVGQVQPQGCATPGPPKGSATCVGRPELGEIAVGKNGGSGAVQAR